MTEEPASWTGSAGETPDVVERLAGVRTWTRGGVRAPHKALLMLLAIARLARTGSSELAFRDVEPELRALLIAFGPPRETYGPQYPFWHLRSDGIWTLARSEGVSTASGHISLEALRERGVGRLTREIESALTRDPRVRAAAVRELLVRNFPESRHRALLDALGLELDAAPSIADHAVKEATRGLRERDPEFRRLILRIYEGRCAFCGYGGRLSGEPVGVEAAHARWHAAGGPDDEENGVAACALHHAAFDSGALSIDHERRALVSESFTSVAPSDDAVLSLVGSLLRAPLASHRGPKREHIDWHHREVFRQPARKPA
jgi:putative restriction endonuclease